MAFLNRLSCCTSPGKKEKEVELPNKELQAANRHVNAEQTATLPKDSIRAPSGEATASRESKGSPESSIEVKGTDYTLSPKHTVTPASTTTPITTQYKPSTTTYRGYSSTGYSSASWSVGAHSGWGYTLGAGTDLGGDTGGDTGGDCGGDTGGDGGGDSGGDFGGDSGGCMLGGCEVRMADGTTKRIEELRRGDKVAGLPVKRGRMEFGSDDEIGVTSAKVECLVAFRVPKGVKDMVRLESEEGALVISPTHYVLSTQPKTNSTTITQFSSTKRPTKKWIHPRNLSTPQPHACQRIYHIVLSPPSNPETLLAVNVGGFWVSTMGQDPNHRFGGDYGAVKRELMRFDRAGRHDGYIELEGLKRGRDGFVCGYF